MLNERPSARTQNPWRALLSLALALLGCTRPTWALGPNLMNNASFEGIYYYSLPAGGPLAIVKDPGNAHGCPRAASEDTTHKFA